MKPRNTVAYYGIGGTRVPNPQSGNEHDPDEQRHKGGRPGAHENRREHGAEKLEARCWCGERTVRVPAETIRRAATLSCGQPECTKENVSARI